MKESIALIAITAALSLTACSGANIPTATVAPATAAASAEPVDDRAPKPFPAGIFFIDTLAGAQVRFHIPVAASDPRVAEIEAYRKEVMARPISYIVAEVDNRSGTVTTNMHSINAFDLNGNRYEFMGVSNFVSEWKPSSAKNGHYVLPDGSKAPEGSGTELYDRGIELGSKYLNGIAPSERGTQILVSTETDLPKEFTRLSVEPNGGMTDAEDAFPAGWVIASDEVAP